MTKKVALYCRVSTRDQDPEAQRRELESYAKAMGYDYTIFEETESSRNTRPIKNEILQGAIKKKWDLILVWKLDRWGRSLNELVNDFDRMIDNDIDFFSLTDGLTIDKKPANRLVANLLGSVAQFERDINQERVLSGIRNAQANGKHCGRPKGSKDKKRRKKGGYYLRYLNKEQG